MIVDKKTPGRLPLADELRDYLSFDHLENDHDEHRDNDTGDTAEQLRAGSLHGVSSREEEITLTPLTGSYKMLSGNGSADSTLPGGHNPAPVISSHTETSSPAGPQDSGLKEAQHKVNHPEPPVEALKIPSNEASNEEKPKKGTRLHLFQLQSLVRDDFDAMILTWSVSELLISQSIIQDHVDKTREEGGPSIVEAYQELSRHERQAIQIKIESYFRPTLVWVKRTFTEITQRGVLFGRVPSLQFVIVHETTGEPLGPLPIPISTAIDSMKELELSRPTYIKVHRKHLSPDTLDAYDLPWE